jgi:ribosomal protein L39E
LWQSNDSCLHPGESLARAAGQNRMAPAYVSLLRA